MLSSEQRNILQTLATHNVLVDAVPGSGKSTTIVEIVNAYQTKAIVVTFNRFLCDSTNLKLPLTAKAFTYHGLLGHLTDEIVSDDHAFATILSQVTNEQFTTWEYQDADMLIIDEVQDIRPQYWIFLRKLLSTFQQPIKVLLVGDVDQLLYDFYNVQDNADPRFIKFASQLLRNHSTRSLKKLPINTSFRLTKPIAAFINKMFQKSIHVVKNGPPVDIFVTEMLTDGPCLIASKIQEVINSGVPLNEIMVLTKSCNERSVARHIVKQLVKYNIPVRVIRTGKLGKHKSFGSDELRNAVTVCTYHAAKGIEAETVFVVRENLLQLTRADFVAFTRAKSKFVLFLSNIKTTKRQLQFALEGLQQTDVYAEVRETLSTSVPEKTHTDLKKLKRAYYIDNMFTFQGVYQLANWLGLANHISKRTINNNKTWKTVFQGQNVAHIMVETS